MTSKRAHATDKEEGGGGGGAKNSGPTKGLPRRKWRIAGSNRAHQKRMQLRRERTLKSEKRKNSATGTKRLPGR